MKDDSLAGKRVVFDKRVLREVGGVRIAVKECSWSSAVDASPVFIEFGEEDQGGWAFMGSSSLLKFIDTLTEAYALARDMEAERDAQP